MHLDLPNLISIIEHHWEIRDALSPQNAPEDLKSALQLIIAQLEQGNLRVASFENKQWLTHSWRSEERRVGKEC